MKMSVFPHFPFLQRSEITILDPWSELVEDSETVKEIESINDCCIKTEKYKKLNRELAMKMRK